jgi:hypothetical protein
MEALASVMRTATHPELIDVVVVQDADDPEVFDLLCDRVSCLVLPTRKWLCEKLNAAIRKADLSRYDYVAWLDDDMRYRTPGWDELVGSRKEMVVYGDDGIPRAESKSTQPFIRVAIPKALGFLVPPELNHCWADNFAQDIGRELGSVMFLPEFKMEHLHHCVGKSPRDQIYKDGATLFEKDHLTWSMITHIRIPALAKQVVEFIKEHP